LPVNSQRRDMTKPLKSAVWRAVTTGRGPFYGQKARLQIADV